MTATASESIGKYQAFGDQELLTSKTMQVFEELDMHVDEKQDHADRAYVQTAVVPDRDHLISLAVRVLDRIGFEDVAVLAMREMKALYEEFAINDDEEFYLGDGMKVTSDGRLVES